MGKGNLFLGFGRGKLGDSVFYRQGGEQAFRARNRRPNNPRTDKQLFQRAVMATCMQCYSAGKAIFDHSFQGRKVGQDNMSRFLSLNAKRIRSGIAAQVNEDEDNFTRVIGPGVVGPVCTDLQVSEGTLKNNQMNIDGSMAVPATAGETIAAYISRAGFQEGDIFTYVCLNCSSVGVIYTAPGAAGDVRGQQFQTALNYAQVRVKAGAASDQTEIDANTTFGAIFEADKYNTAEIDLTTKLVGTSGIFTGDILDYSLATAMEGIIKSREDSGLRSTCILTPNALNDGEYGLTGKYLWDAWRAGTVPVGDPTLILEGSDF